MSKTKTLTWDHITFVRLTIPFLLGIVCFRNTELPYILLMILLILCYFIVDRLFTKNMTLAFRFKWVYGVLITALFLFFGGWRIHNYDHKNKPNFFEKIDTSTTRQLIIQLSDEPEKKPNSYKSEASIEYVYANNRWEKAEGSLMVYMQKDLFPKNIPTYGQLYQIRTKLSVPEPPLNPHQFDYRYFLENNNIYHIAYINEPNDLSYVAEGGFLLRKLAYKIRVYCIRVLSKYLNEDVFPIAAALIVGAKDYLDPEHYTTFSHTGTMHILAVSGLHVGLIYASIIWVLNFLLTGAKNQKWKSIIVLLLIWIFGAVTGFEPAILRAVIMFSFLELGKLQNKITNNYNILAAVAFFMAVWNPLSIYSLSFILSFSAIIGIMYFYELILDAFTIKNTLVKEGWKLIAMSLAAQITTLPILLYYFHQFPPIFIITNLFAIPISNLIVIAGLILCVFDFIPYMGYLLAANINILLAVFYYGLYYLEMIPYSNIKGIVFPMMYLYAFYLCLIAYVFLREIDYPKLRIAHFLIASLLLIGGSSFIVNINHSNLKTLTIYNDRKLSLFEHTTNNVSYYYPDSLNSDSVANYAPYISGNNRILHNIHNYYPITELNKQSSNLVMIDSTIIIDEYQFIIASRNYIDPIDEHPFINKLSNKQIYDDTLGSLTPRDTNTKKKILWVSKKSYWTEQELIALAPDMLIIDATCNNKKTNFYDRMAEKNDLLLWNIRESGAFHIEY